MILTPPWTPGHYQTLRGLWHQARAESLRRETLHDGNPVTFEIRDTDLTWPFPYPSIQQWQEEVDAITLRREYGE